jgi:hypothetical protein
VGKKTHKKVSKAPKRFGKLLTLIRWISKVLDRFSLSNKSFHVPVDIREDGHG